MLGDVAVAGEAVGRGPVVLDADVPGLRALDLGGDWSDQHWSGSGHYLVQLRHHGTVHAHQALQVRGGA